MRFPDGKFSVLAVDNRNGTEVKMRAVIFGNGTDEFSRSPIIGWNDNHHIQNRAHKGNPLNCLMTCDVVRMIEDAINFYVEAGISNFPADSFGT